MTMRINLAVVRREGKGWMLLFLLLFRSLFALRASNYCPHTDTVFPSSGVHKHLWVVGSSNVSHTFVLFHRVSGFDFFVDELFVSPLCCSAALRCYLALDKFSNIRI